MSKNLFVLILIFGLNACSHLSSSTGYHGNISDNRLPASNNPDVTELAQKIEKKIYNQALGPYFRADSVTDRTGGRLINPSSLINIMDTPLGTAVEANGSPMILTSATGDWAVASGLTIDILKYAAIRLSEEFNSDDYKLYVELSSKKITRKYKSHANGLDILLVPMIRVEGELKHIRDLKTDNATNYINAIFSILDETKRIFAIFTPYWVRKLIDKPKVSYPVRRIIGLNNISVRIVCNEQNQGCFVQRDMVSKW